MALEERSKTDFSNILDQIQNKHDRKYEIIHIKWTDDKYFEIKFRTQIQRNSEDFNALCDEWVDLFSKVTNTVWVKKISNTGPKIRFRKQYQCWTHEGKVVQKELLFDARRCKGTLDMKVLTDNPLTRRKNKHIRLGLNVVVKINFIHLHAVDANKSCSFFVHTCKPLPEAPKPTIQPNERLPELIANMVQKGLKASKGLQTDNNNKEVSQQEPYQQNNQTIINIQGNKNDSLFVPQIQLHQEINQHQIPQQPHQQQQEQQQHHQHQHQQQQQQQQHHQQTISLIQNIPMEAIKLELSPHLQQYTQVVAVGDLSEPLLMCQSLMFDTSQIIPVNALPSHFVQITPQNLNQ